MFCVVFFLVFLFSVSLGRYMFFFLCMFCGFFSCSVGCFVCSW